MYGNYDNKNKPPVFDIYLGANYWGTFKETTTDDLYLIEIITMANDDFLQVCLINKNQGAPFISWLDLRPLETSMYQYANSTYSLVYSDRLNIGASDYTLIR
jgi:Malectin-like domain